MYFTQKPAEEDIDGIEKKSIHIQMVNSLHQSAALNNSKIVQRFRTKLIAD